MYNCFILLEDPLDVRFEEGFVLRPSYYLFFMANVSAHFINLRKRANINRIPFLLTLFINYIFFGTFWSNYYHLYNLLNLTFNSVFTRLIYYR